jgi:signal peptidase
MEITTSPHRPASTPWRRLLAFAVVLGPVSVLVLLPIGLGLERYVVTSHAMDSGRAGGIRAGSVVLEREVPVDDLAVGDVVTYRPPASTGVDGMVTHRIVSVGPGGIVTRGDALADPDPWVLSPDRSTLPRVELVLPWVGYAYLLVRHPYTWLLLTVSAVLLALLLATETSRRRQQEATRDEEAPRAGVSVGPGTSRKAGGAQE